MKTALLLMGLALGAATAPVSAQRVGEGGLVTFHCNDLVVIGRFENLDYEHVEIEDDILGHGWITARVRVRRVLSGRAEGRVVPVRYFAHTYYRDDRDFVLVINRAAPGRTLIRSAHLIEGNRRPRLAHSCE